ncbi:MAG: hypothetical protein ACTSU7_01410 [Candidatus Heimdallarchaeaceae archaeon]
MINLRLLEISQKLIKERKKKENELERREKREKYLQKVADQEYKCNKEQWEALVCCIEHQQKRSVTLINDILKIKEALGVIKIKQIKEAIEIIKSKNGKENRYDWYA